MVCNYLKNKKILFVLGVFIFCSWNSFAKMRVPYTVSGEFTLDENPSVYEMCGINVFFQNDADVEVEEFTIVFFLFDSDGEPVSTGKNNISIRVEEKVFPKESYNCCLSLDDYMYLEPAEDFYVDYMYVSKILYSDGSVWDDPFGMQLF